MSSVVYYRFRSSKTQSRLTFDGTGISVFEIKRGILLAQKLDTTADAFQLILSSPDTGEEYKDDSEVLPRSSLVEARRLPLSRPGGHGAASYYVSGSLASAAKNASRRENFKGTNGANDAQDENAEMLTSAAGSGSEQDMMNVMFAQQGAQWSKTQQEMASKPKIYTPKAPVNYSTEPDKTVPPGYICHRCGQKGHWIHNCPSLHDKNWETKKVLRTTGIPKSMLRTISQGALNGENPPDDGRTYLMNAEGELVVAVADDKSWEAFQARQREQQAKNKRQIPEELQDPITHELMRDPRRMPCCGKVYSDQSIENALIQTDFKCPNCGREEVYIDQLEVDKDMQAKVSAFLAQESGAGASSASSSAEPGETPKAEQDMDVAVDDNDQEDEDDDDSDYSPTGMRKRRRRSSASSFTSNASGGSMDSDISMKRTKQGENPQVADVASQPVANAPPVNPMMMPFMFNPFMMGMANQQPGQQPNKQDEYNQQDYDSDYESGDERPVVGRIR